MNKPILYVMMGLPASGKSSLAEEIAWTKDATIISSDAIRKEWYGDESIQGNPTKIFEEMRKRTVSVLENGRSVVYDATNLTLKSRYFLRNYSPLLKIRNKIKVNGILCATPFDVCCERNSNRIRVVPMETITRMLKSFTPPMLSEGFDFIVLYKSYEGEASRDWLNFMNMSHDNPHHLETIEEHLSWCTKAIEEAGREDISSLGFYHDIGKVYCKEIGKDGVAHFYNHECVSSYITVCDLLYSRSYDNLTFSDRVKITNEILYMASLVRWHMELYHGDFSDKQKLLFGERTMADLRFFNEIDRRCRRV